jgi:hypothetical protein
MDRCGLPVLVVQHSSLQRSQISFWTIVDQFSMLKVSGYCIRTRHEGYVAINLEYWGIEAPNQEIEALHEKIGI